MEISQERLKEMISSAYEEGWRGFLEMRDEYAASVASKFAAEQPQVASITVGDFSATNALSPYYYYTTTTSVPSTITAGGEGVI